MKGERIEQRILDKMSIRWIWANPFNEIVEQVYKDYQYTHNYLRYNTTKQILQFDTNKIFGHPIASVIDYLKTLDQSAIIDIQDECHGEFEISLFKYKEELDEDYIIRLHTIFSGADFRLTKIKKERSKLKKRKNELINEIKEINKKLKC